MTHHSLTTRRIAVVIALASLFVLPGWTGAPRQLASSFWQQEPRWQPLVRTPATDDLSSRASVAGVTSQADGVQALDAPIALSYHYTLPEDDGPVQTGDTGFELPSRPAGTCMVNSAADSGANTLRACLQNAVAGDTIRFDPAVFPPSNPRTIYLTSASLPSIRSNNIAVDASDAGVILDGTALPGPYTYGIVINGANAARVRGLQIRGFYIGVILQGGANHSTVGGDRSVGAGPMGQGNLIGDNDVGVLLGQTGTSANVVIGNFIGTDLAGNVAHANHIQGVAISDGSSNNIIGGSRTPGACDGSCNVISGNLDEAIRIQVAGTTGNRILGNFIGTNVSGSGPVANGQGIVICCGGSTTQVGGTPVGEGNVISGNTTDGVLLSGSAARNNQIVGNLIGTNSTGTAALANNHGVVISEGANNQIGGSAPGAGNLISGNTFGVWIAEATAQGNLVQGNRIGTNAAGTQALPNYKGVLITRGASGNTVGGSAPGTGNVISGNEDYGARIELASSVNTLKGNSIGTNATGSASLPNGTDGILISHGASNNTIGGTASGEGNLISGNGQSGIKIQNDDTTGNRVLGNRIGTNLAGSSTIPNGAHGVLIISAQNTTVGGAHTPWVCTGACNLISGNGAEGVMIQGQGAVQALAPDYVSGEKLTDFRVPSLQNNQVIGNFIGTNLAGLSPLPNNNGVALDLGATGNALGGSGSGEGNLISGNRYDGVTAGSEPTYPLTAQNRIVSNRIGTVANGQTGLGNGRAGVFLDSGSGQTTVGGLQAGEGNVISGHGTDTGIFIQNMPPWQNGSGVGNEILGNFIGTGATGMIAVPNLVGLTLLARVTDTNVTRNVISGNSGNGVQIIQDPSVSDVPHDNDLSQNLIGVAADGQTPLPNGDPTDPSTGTGVFFDGATQNRIGPGNAIAHNLGPGVVVNGIASLGNTITQSRIFANGYRQILLQDIPASTAPPPGIGEWVGTTVSGTACSSCIVELFANSDGDAAGEVYIDSVTADSSGHWALQVGPEYDHFSATATYSDRTTSEFAAAIGVIPQHKTYLPRVHAK